MIDSKLVLAIVPARGGSKGIPLKNLKKINGNSLVAIAGEVVSKVPEIDRAIISSDHIEIINEASKYGLDAPFVRPDEISGDRIGDLEVLTHAIRATEEQDGCKYDLIVMLQPTSPLRTSRDISGAIKMLIEKKLDAVWTISETDSKSHPYKQLSYENGLIDYWSPNGGSIIARQELDSVYHRNGIAYVFTRECILSDKTIMGHRTGGYLIDRECVSIDTEWDLILTEFISSKIKVE